MKENKEKFFVSLCLRGKGFTLLELVVAIGILAMVVFFVGTIFKAAIGSYRTASAQAEIMQKLRAITNQLNNDFGGRRREARMIVWFEVTNDSNDRFDQIMFFADGDFQSVQTYDTDVNNSPYYQIPRPTGSPIVGNVARIQYGQASLYSPAAGRYVNPNEQIYENNPDRFFNKKCGTLARRQHILTADPNIIPWPDSSDFINSFDPNRNDYYEHDTNSLSQWEVLFQTLFPLYQDHILDICFHYRPRINYQDSTGLHMLMAEGVSNLMIQLTVDDANGVSWQPGNDAIRNSTLPPFSWRAMKFTFTLYDSRGVFKDGQTFTHIVYLGD